MGTAFAPGLSRNRSWVLLPLTSLVCVCVVVSGALAFAQDEKKKAVPPNPDNKKVEIPNLPPPPTKEEVAKAKAEAEARSDAAESAYDTFFDPNIEPTLANTFPELRDAPLNSQDEQRLLVMAAGGTPDPNLIDRYVRHFAAELTKQANIEPILKEDSKSRNAQAIDNAGVKLQEPIRNAGERNFAFMTEYRKSLLRVTPDLLKGHLYSRIQGIIALAMAKAPEAIPIYLEQIRDPKQVLPVKIWSLRGISLLSDHGRNESFFRGQIQAQAVETIVKYANEESLPWYAKIRAVEALGSLRQASANIRGGKVESAETILKLLADPNQKPEVRAWAGWALGMMRVPPQIPDYNYGLAAYWMGRCVVDIGQDADNIFELRIAQDDEDENKKKAELVYNGERINAFANLISVQLYRGFAGEDGVRDSGLSKVSTGSHATVIRNIDARVVAVAKAIIELNRSAGVLVPQSRKAMSDAVTDLNDYLSQNRPTTWALTPNGARFAPIGATTAPIPAASGAGAGASSR